MTTHFYSMYWSNISPILLSAQKQVFEKFDLPLLQMERTGIHHGDWIDQIIADAAEDDDFLFLDVDCIPLNAEVVHEAINKSKQGIVVGVSQTANHLPNPDIIYAAPSFLAFSKRTWLKVGAPSFAADQNFDVAGRFTAACREHDVQLVLLEPYFVAFPKWPLGQKCCLGLATFYDGGVFHLFQSRESKFDDVVKYVSQSVIHGTKIDYSNVMKMTLCSNTLNKIAMKAPRPIRGIIYKYLRRPMYLLLDLRYERI